MQYSIQYKNNHQLRVYVGNYIVGGIDLDVRTKEHVEIESYWVEIPYQGHGIGKALLTETISYCRRNRVQTISVLSAYDYTVAMYLYQRFGFVIVSEFEELVLMHLTLD